MRILERSQSKLILKDELFLSRILTYVGIGVGILLMLFVDIRQDKETPYFWIGLAIALFALFSQILWPEETLCIFDAKNQKLFIRRSRAWFKTRKEEYSLNQVSQIRIEAQKPALGAKNNVEKYRISLELEGDSWIPVTRRFNRWPLNELESIGRSIQQFLQTASGQVEPS